MKRSWLKAAAIAILAVAFLAIMMWVSAQPRPPTRDVPTVEVTLGVIEQVVDFESFTGRFEASRTVEIRSRVGGMLEKVHFRDGQAVREGDLLFEIDPRSEQAELDMAEANVERAQERFASASVALKRAKQLQAQGRLAQNEFDRITEDAAVAKASLTICRVKQEGARAKLESARIKAPIAGEIGRRLVDPGTVILADVTPLTTIVWLDPMYVYFEVEERTFLRLRRLAREGVIPIQVGLTDEVDLTGELRFPHKGEIDFSDNKVDAATGTIQFRGKIANPELRGGTRLLLPGLFAQVRLPVGGPHQAILIPERALARNQGQRVIYAVEQEKDKKGGLVNKAHKRPVEVRPFSKGLMVIEKGLKHGERVVVNGLQEIRDDMEVRVELAWPPR